MNNSYNSPELIFPSSPMVVPIQMLGLFQYSNVSNFIWNAFCNISNRENASHFFRKLHHKKRSQVTLLS